MLLLSKNDVWSHYAARIAEVAFPGVRHVAGTRHDAFPLDGEADADYVISFLSPWIVPRPVLERVTLAINFHPASARYPGIGCYNFALYENATEYGAVAHHMAARPDTGALIEQRLFPVFPADTVETLKLRTMVVMLALFQDIVTGLAAGNALPRTDAVWQRAPFTRRQLDELAVITPDMDAAEIARRVRATTYPGYPGPAVTLGGRTFSAAVPEREPFA